MKTFVFTGVATVSVETEIEADNEEQARQKAESGDCVWQCDYVDGDVSEIEVCP